MSETIRRRRIARALVSAACLVAAGPVQAVDGRIEINQTCAQITGCLTGDAPGFPVSIGQSGSYILTGNLNLPNTNTTAVEFSSGDVDIDLNGFGIEGPGGSGSGFGIRAVSGTETGATIRNGFVRGVGDTGIVAGSHAHVADVSVSNSGNNGVVFFIGGILEGSRVFDNGGVGVVAGGGSALHLVRNTIASNGSGPLFQSGLFGGDFSFGPGNVCDDARCSGDSRRAFYLTTTTHSGSSARSACDDGFHMASLWEVHDVSGLRYDTARGATKADSGAGPPNDGGLQSFNPGGWVRTGAVSTSSGTAGTANCSAYTSTSGDGTAAFLVDNWTLAGEVQSPWDARVEFCNVSLPVWCIQD